MKSIRMMLQQHLVATGREPGGTPGSAGGTPALPTFYGMIRSVDDNFGRLRAVLQELGLEQNTLLVFTSGNGPCSGSRPIDRHMAGLHGLKGTVYESGIRVPCFMRWPAGFASPARVTRLAAHIDHLVHRRHPAVGGKPGGTAPIQTRATTVSRWKTNNRHP